MTVPPHSAVPRRHGMTLVEVILAVMILSISMVVLLTAMSRCLVVMKVVGNYHRAQWVLGQAELDHPLDLLGRPRDLTPEDLEVADQDYEGYTFSRSVEDPDQDAEQPARLLIVRSRVAWSDRGREMREEVVRYVYYKEK
jgi:prepilin-type N-terminal cleavage/methylation domain-containing protein